MNCDDLSVIPARTSRTCTAAPSAERLRRRLRPAASSDEVRRCGTPSAAAARPGVSPPTTLCKRPSSARRRHMVATPRKNRATPAPASTAAAISGPGAIIDCSLLVIPAAALPDGPARLEEALGQGDAVPLQLGGQLRPHAEGLQPADDAPPLHA